MLRQLSIVLLAYLLLNTGAAHAQLSERFGPYELHYSVVNTTFLDPKVAATYGITRGKKRAILNLAVREHLEEGGTAGRPMLLKGRTWDLIQGQELDFLEVREGDAIYYVAEFKFIDEEWRHFQVYFRPEGATETFDFKLKHQLYIN